MSQELWESVDKYFCDLLLSSDPILEGALASSAAAGLPAIQVTPNQGKFLHLLARIQRARTILEIGTLGGYSTIWLARALAAGGCVTTLEVEPLHAKVARENFERAGLQGVIDLRVGRAIETLPKLQAEGLGPFDFIFIDADKSSTPEYFSWALKLSQPGTVIIVDNVVRKGAVIDGASSDVDVRGVRRFMEMASKESRVSATAIQTVGSKGYDGFTILIVEG